MVIALVIATASAGFAGGSNAYPNGAEGFWMGAVPPPGFYYVNYDLWYTAHKYTNDGGQQVTTGPLAGFRLNVLANVSRFLYVSKYQILGANWGVQAFVPVMDQRITSVAGVSHARGIGDVIVDPFILSWHKPNFHAVVGIDIYLPTGDYKTGRLANLGTNTFVYEPVAAFTYVTPVKGVTASIKMMYDFPQKNGKWAHPFLPLAGALLPGQEFHFDYSIDYTINETWRAGLGGYWYKQTTEDELNGAKIPNAQGRVWSVGPGIEYSKGKVIASLRTQFEVNAKNRPEGVSNWLRLVLVL